MNCHQNDVDRFIRGRRVHLNRKRKKTTSKAILLIGVSEAMARNHGEITQKLFEFASKVSDSKARLIQECGRLLARG